MQVGLTRRQDRRLNCPVWQPELLEMRRLMAATPDVASFATLPGTHFAISLVCDSRGNLYGTTAQNGYYDLDMVFEIPAGTNSISPLVSLSGAKGTIATSLIVGPDGNLYGTAADGGPSHNGSVFEIVSNTRQFLTIATFDGTDGSAPNSLLFDETGDLYGTTSAGGPGYNRLASNGPGGTVFEIAKGNSTISTLATFNGSNGTSPHDLTFDAAGNLYGTAQYGGSSGYSPSNPSFGTVFEVTAGTRAFSTLVNFDGANGSEPNSLLCDADGNLFGSTRAGGSDFGEPFPGTDETYQGSGTVFEVHARTHSLETLASLAGIASSVGPIITDAAGNLFGVAAYGGVVFEVPHGTSAITQLAYGALSYLSSDGMLAFDPSGTLYGTAYNEDSTPSGSIFKLDDSGFVVNDSAPVVTLQPVSKAIVVNQSTSLTVAAVGFPVGSVQWQQSVDGGKTFQDVTGSVSAVTPTLQLTSPPLRANGTQYRAVFSNSAGTTSTQPATLYVLPPLHLTAAARAGVSILGTTSSAISASAVDPSGTSQLTYSWSAIGSPIGSAAPTFTNNGTFSARKTRVTFHKSGRYTLRCTISDGGVRQIVTDTTVTVKQTAARVRVTPASSAVFRLGVKQLTATVYDQFNKPMRIQPPIDFSIASGEGTIDSSGLFTATTLPGLVDIEARAGQLAGVATVNVE